MYFQNTKLRTGASWGVGATYRQDLPESGLLSGVYFHVYGSPVTDARLTTEKWRIMDYISEMRVVANGAKVLFKLNGRMLHYLNWYQGAPAIRDQHHNYGSSTLRHHGFIPFGRYPFDTLNGLDLSKYDNVELQFTNDTTADIFASGWSIDTGLVLLRDADPRQFLGHIETEEYRRWTTVQNEIKYIDLPTVGMLRNVLIQVDADVDANNVAETTLYNTLYNLKMTLRDSLEEVYDGSLRDLWQLNSLWDWRGNRIVGAEPYQTDAYGVRTGLGQTFYKAGSHVSHTGNQATYDVDYVPGEDGHTQTRQADGDSDQFSSLFAGMSIENCARLDFDLNADPTTWLNLDRKKTAKLEVTTRDAASAADGVITVALPRMFPN